MITFEKEELLKIADLSCLKLSAEELEIFAQQLRQILEYTSQISQAELAHVPNIQNNVNVFREDKVHPEASNALVELACEHKDNYFVVPKIL